MNRSFVVFGAVCGPRAPNFSRPECTDALALKSTRAYWSSSAARSSTGEAIERRNSAHIQIESLNRNCLADHPVRLELNAAAKSVRAILKALALYKLPTGLYSQLDFVFA